MSDGWHKGSALPAPPANIEAEQALLGALLANGKAYDRVGGFLLPEHFADPLHGRIYGAIRRRIEAGQVADAVTLRAEWQAEIVEGLPGGAVSGAAYIAQLVGCMVGIINAGEYGRVIHDAWLRRELVALGTCLVNDCHGEGEAPHRDARDILAAADESLLSLTAPGGVVVGARDGQAVAGALMDNVMAAVARKGALPGLTFGLRGLDRMTGGMRPGQLILIGGRPSMGKTSMGLTVATGAAGAGARVLFVSAEMLSQDIMARAACAAAGLPLSAYPHAGIEGPDGRLRTLDPPEMDALADGARRLGDLSITWDDESVTIQAIRARARQMRRRGGLDAIVVDYLGRLRASESVQRFGLNSIVTELSAGLKDLAKSLGIPVVVLAQLSRQVEQREDKTPLLSDLRDSGSLEQDADVVIFLYREHYYLIRATPQKSGREKTADFDARMIEWEARCIAARGKAVAIVAKQRQGRTGPVRLGWQDATAQFTDDDTGGRD
jgi:replicative DNA helicase